MQLSHQTWRDDDVVGFLDDVNGLVHVDLGVGADDLHGLPARGGGGAVPAQDHVGQRAVHRLESGGKATLKLSSDSSLCELHVQGHYQNHRL